MKFETCSVCEQGEAVQGPFCNVCYDEMEEAFN